MEENARKVAELFSCEHIFHDAETMIGKVQPEAMAILTPLHADLVKLGLENDIDLFVEKPFCETADIAVRMTKLAEARKCVVQVGAMRVLDPALDYIRSQIAVIGPIRWVEIHDYCGQSLSSGSSGSMIASTFQSSLTVSEGRPRNAIQTMLFEFIHDLSILRAVFGSGISCNYSSISKDGWSATGVLQLPGEIPCIFGTTEYGLPKVNHFEVCMKLYGENGFLEADFGDANNPDGGLSVIEQSSGVEKLFRSDVFMEEWQVFYKSVKNRKPNKNNAADGASDVSLGYEIVEMGLF